jgi:hypothetical protein
MRANAEFLFKRPDMLHKSKQFKLPVVKTKEWSYTYIINPSLQLRVRVHRDRQS